MEIVITHTIHPDVIALLKSFVNPGFGGQQVKEVAAAPVESIKPAKPSKPAAPAKEAVKETPAAEGPTAAPAAEVKTLEYTDIRQVYMQKKDEGKQEAVRKILTDEYGVEKLSAIKPEQFEEVYNKIKAL